MLIFILFLLSVCSGALVGGLLNTALLRFRRGEKLTRRNFFCQKCGKKLKLKSLIPVISFIRQRGKCLNCGGKINLGYFLLEVINATVYGLLFFLLGFGVKFIYMSLLFSFLLAFVLSDIENQEIPIHLQIVLCIFILIRIVFSALDPIYAIVCAVAYFALVELARIAVKNLFNREMIGGGDLILIALSGLMLTFEYLAIFFVLLGVLGTIWGIIFRLWKKKSGPFPFAPVIVLVLYSLLLHHYTVGRFTR
ncbi:MAG: prepilin peptidase [Rickettsiales bacterium]|jgi:prepilin signal peptidase PulO-like enzyme (type II secretory pathway)|nr:prepilin peptidase [Rickettsiales bacterium]